jgi:6-phosphogluconolactonase (cycloisomerase 2 family)
MSVRGRGAWLAVPAVLVASSWGAAPVAYAAPPLGALTQLTGVNACIQGQGSTPVECVGNNSAIGLNGFSRPAVSPDGRNVYMHGNKAIAEFARDPLTGGLTQLASANACIGEEGGGTACPTTGVGLSGEGGDLAVSPDGRNVYAVSSASGVAAVAEFARDPATGALTQLPAPNACIQEMGTSSSDCARTGPGLTYAAHLVVSPDGHNVYVTGFTLPGSIAEFSRNSTTGALTQLPASNACIQGAGSTPTECSGNVAKGLTNPSELVASPDGLNVYVAGGESDVAEFTRDPVTGALTQLAGASACIQEHGAITVECVGNNAAVGLNPGGLAVSPDGANLYAGGNSEAAVSAFVRNPTSGALTQLAGAAACIQNTGVTPVDCASNHAGHGLLATNSVLVSPDGGTVYVTGNSSHAVAEFSREKSTGVLQQLPPNDACLQWFNSETFECGTNITAHGLRFAAAMGLTPDGSSLYVQGTPSGGGGMTLVELAPEITPLCTSTSQSVPFGGSVQVPLACRGTIGSPLTIAVLTGPAHATLGAVNQLAGTVAYTPSAGFSGTDSFTFQASDGTYTSKPATATLRVQPQPASGGGVPSGPSGGSVVRPALTALRVSPSTIRAAPSGVTLARKKAKPKTGATISYNDSQAATTTFAILRATAGVRSGKRCIAPPRHPAKRRKAKRCTRLVAVGSFTHIDRAGSNRLPFSGRLHGHKLAPGSYTLTATPALGKLVGQTASTHFTIKR